jgi:radical SAM superfamily enzyme YgiQ (UPF0313 family)
MVVAAQRLAARYDRAGLRLARHGLRVALVRPPVVTAPRSLSYYGAVPDLGLAYVAAAVRQAGHDVTLIDASGEALDTVRPWQTPVGTLHRQGLGLPEIVARIPADVDVVGLAHMFLHEWGLLRELIAAIRDRFGRALIVAGGENATAYWERMLAEAPGLDACVLGEGEATFTELLGRVEAGQAWQDTPAVAARGASGPRANERESTDVGARPGLQRGRIVELDALPRPAWDLFPLEAYFARGLGSGVDRGRALPLLTSRGCPYRCSFCSSPSMWTTRYVRRDPEAVLDEIEDVVATYRVDNVNVNDLTALLTKAWLLEFCAGIRRRGLAINWQLPSGTRSEAIDEEAARAMADAGCRNFCYAPESGSPPELERMKKRVKLPRLRASLRGAVAAGLKTQASIIIGMPHQGAGDLWRTYRFILQMAADGLHAVSVLVFAPYPGSEEFERLRAAGAVELDERYLYGSLLRSVGTGRSHHPWLGATSLWALQYAMMGSFFAAQYVLRPRRAAELARNLATGRQETALELMLATKARQLFHRRRARLRAALSRVSGRRWAAVLR